MEKSVEMDSYEIFLVTMHGEQIPACTCGALLNDTEAHIRFHRRFGHLAAWRNTETV